MYLIIFQSFTISTLEKSFGRNETEILCSQLKIHSSRPISGTYSPTYPKNSVSRMYPFRHYFLVYDVWATLRVDESSSTPWIFNELLLPTFKLMGYLTDSWKMSFKIYFQDK